MNDGNAKVIRLQFAHDEVLVKRSCHERRWPRVREGVALMAPTIIEECLV
jgi:hypothetical protein